MNITDSIVTSQNWTQGREGSQIIGIVLHTMVGTVASSQERFNNPRSQVSVHYGVGLDGSITRWVEEANTAWQAGDWITNLRTIGIEHEDGGNANDSTRTTALYESSSNLVADICKRYNIPCNTNFIFLHKNVIDTSVYPGGTSCPDGLDTDKIISMAASKLQEEDMPNSGDVVNAYAYVNEKATQADIDIYTSKPWNAQDGLFYGKVVVDLRNLQKQVQSLNTQLAAAGDAPQKLAQVKQIVG